MVEVTPDGENYLILAISPGTELTVEQVDDALVQVAALVITVQLDMPPAPISKVLTESRREAIRVGNLIPHPALDRDLMCHLDVLVVNQHEAATILGVAEVDAVAAAQSLRDLGPSGVVVTAGSRGAAYSHSDLSDIVGAATVPVSDTTGAGDAFLGSLALDLARGMPMPVAVAHAVEIGTEAVQHQGAQLRRRTPEEPSTRQ